MFDWDGHCHRCGKKAIAHITSFFNEQLICMTCSEEERARPDFEKARAADEAAIRSGDYNFPGIGMKGD